MQVGEAQPHRGGLHTLQLLQIDKLKNIPLVKRHPKLLQYIEILGLKGSPPVVRFLVDDVLDSIIPMLLRTRKRCEPALPAEASLHPTSAVDIGRGVSFKIADEFGQGDGGRHLEEDVDMVEPAVYGVGKGLVLSELMAEELVEVVAVVLGDEVGSSLNDEDGVDHDLGIGVCHSFFGKYRDWRES